MPKEKELTSLPANRSFESFAQLPGDKMFEFPCALADLMVYCNEKFGIIPEVVYSVKKMPGRYYVLKSDVIKVA